MLRTTLANKEQVWLLGQSYSSTCRSHVWRAEPPPPTPSGWISHHPPFVTFLIVQTDQRRGLSVTSSARQLTPPTNLNSMKSSFMFFLNVLDRGVAPAPQTAAGSSLATTPRGQSSSSEGPRPCCRGGLRAWRRGLGTPRRSTSSSEAPRHEQPASAHTPSGGR